MIKKFLFVCVVWGISSMVFAQDIEIFKVSDFNLKGNVKSCFVITDYGKEEYYFDINGLLEKSITRFNDTDYETTSYKYLNGYLKERRVENYMDGAFDYATSIASFYEIDTTDTKTITEEIVSYEKKLIEKNIYSYDKDGKLVKLIRSNTSGIDESNFEYITNDSIARVKKTANGLLSKLTTTSTVVKNEQNLKKVVSESYMEGNLTSKIVEVFNMDARLTVHKELMYDSSTEKWIPQTEEHFIYDENGFLATTKTKKRFGDLTQQYIYQFDGTPANNWVKEIITPDNTYTTRQIEYYPSDDKIETLIEDDEN
ncbi:hypothetical protein [Zobellia uliginosa]|uniref:hypothetical protein n=1 Tax=Zobellia uliginosa TaxID=143224 RepID=UPI001C06C49A|nr:hypothetical protein [Zobellia uliginosa]MBU2946166.1 hypothetical protein [Zobellia uliginosa]